ncbi:MAG: Glutathione transport system permease protein GsiD [Firmicutes bacterium]|nr:Glutathione transport system permease protein GsiD [candidate division NPL-UPA2 bacterium]
MATANPQVTKPYTSMAAKEETFWSLTWYRFRRHKLAMFFTAVLLVMYAIALIAPYIAPHDPMAIHVGPRFAPMSPEFPFGTDRLGRDLLSRVLHGSRISLMVGFVAAGIAMTLGTLAGAVAGYFGGVIDDVIMRICEVMMAIPTFFLLLTVVAIFERSLLNIMLVIGFTTWPSAARLVRGQFLSLREMDYVEAARSVGARNSRIVMQHILPNCMAPIIVSTTLRVGGAMLTEAGLAFIGLGVTDPPSWGSLMETGRHTLRFAPHMTYIPGLLIFATVLAYNYIGDGLRDALDPKLK